LSRLVRRRGISWRHGLSRDAELELRYYLLYFAPFVPLFIVHRMWTQEKLKDVRIWASLAGRPSPLLR
jgi:hypothetical protein